MTVETVLVDFAVWIQSVGKGSPVRVRRVAVPTKFASIMNVNRHPATIVVRLSAQKISNVSTMSVDESNVIRTCHAKMDSAALRAGVFKELHAAADVWPNRLATFIATSVDRHPQTAQIYNAQRLKPWS